jgi:hypothetical protein
MAATDNSISPEIQDYESLSAIVEDLRFLHWDYIEKVESIGLKLKRQEKAALCNQSPEYANFYAALAVGLEVMQSQLGSAHAREIGNFLRDCRGAIKQFRESIPARKRNQAPSRLGSSGAT